MSCACPPGEWSPLCDVHAGRCSRCGQWLTTRELTDPDVTLIVNGMPRHRAPVCPNVRPDLTVVSGQ